MKILMRIALTPVMFIARLTLGCAAFLVTISSALIGLTVSVFMGLALIEFFIGYWQNGIAFLVLALLASPIGLPGLAHLTLDALDKLCTFIEVRIS